LSSRKGPNKRGCRHNLLVLCRIINVSPWQSLTQKEKSEKRPIKSRLFEKKFSKGDSLDIVTAGNRRDVQTAKKKDKFVV